MGVRIDTEEIAGNIKAVDADGYEHVADVEHVDRAMSKIYELPGTVGLYACARCGSVVAGADGQETHDRWHLAIGSGK